MDTISKTLEKYLNDIRYGEVSVSLTVHNGQVVKVAYTITEKKKGEA